MNKVDIEKMAVEWVLKYEKKQGRRPKVVFGCGYDILSDKLKIEVKGRSKDKRPHILFNENNINAIEKEKDENYRLYVVMNPGENPKLIIFSKSEILDKKIEKRQWVIPLRKKDFDKGIPLKQATHRTAI